MHAYSEHDANYWLYMTNQFLLEHGEEAYTASELSVRSKLPLDIMDSLLEILWDRELIRKYVEGETIYWHSAQRMYYAPQSKQRVAQHEVPAEPKSPIHYDTRDYARHGRLHLPSMGSVPVMQDSVYQSREFGSRLFGARSSSDTVERGMIRKAMAARGLL